MTKSVIGQFVFKHVSEKFFFLFYFLRKDSSKFFLQGPISCFVLLYEFKYVALVELCTSKEYNANQILTSKCLSWIINCMRKADKNEDNKMTLKELKHFLRQINVEVDDTYAEEIFKVSVSENESHLNSSISCLNDCFITSHVL